MRTQLILSAFVTVAVIAFSGCMDTGDEQSDPSADNGVVEQDLDNGGENLLGLHQ
jgi:hypothetical protein